MSLKGYDEIECPECGSEKVSDNGNNEHICNECGETFYVSDRDDITEGIRYETVGTSFYEEE